MQTKLLIDAELVDGDGEVLSIINPETSGEIIIVHGLGHTSGDQLINSPQMEAITITGSAATGMAAMRAASTQIRQVMVTHS